MDPTNLTSEKEMLDAIKTAMRNNGQLNKFQAQMRASVIELLQDKNSASCGDRQSRAPAQPSEVLLVNELIREYLHWVGYVYTESVMTSEAALPPDIRSRADLCIEVGVRDDEKSSSLPLLCNIVAAYTERIKRKINKCKKEMQ